MGISIRFPRQSTTCLEVTINSKNVPYGHRQICENCTYIGSQLFRAIVDSLHNRHQFPHQFMFLLKLEFPWSFVMTSFIFQELRIDKKTNLIETAATLKLSQPES